MISIIIPVFNNENGILKTIDSIKNLKFNNFEVIIVNDGSSDRTEENIRNAIVDDSRFFLFSNKNHGVSYSRNYGIEHANGKYITFVDSGDTLNQDSYEYLELLSNDIDMVMFSLDRVENTNRITKKIPFVGVLEKEKITTKLMPMFLAPLKNDRINEPLMGSACRIVIKKQLIKENSIRFLENLMVAEDLIFCLEVLKVSSKIYCLDKSYYNYIREENSAIERYRDDLWENSMKCEKELLRIFSSTCKKEDYFLRFKVFQFYQCTWALSNLNRISSKVKNKNAKNNEIHNYFKKNINNNFDIFKELSINRKIIYILFMLKFNFILNLLFKLKEKKRVSKY